MLAQQSGRQGVPGRGKGMCKVPEVGKSLEHLKNFNVRLYGWNFHSLEHTSWIHFVLITQPENPPNRDALIYI